MDLILERSQCEADGIFSILGYRSPTSDVVVAVTLEHAYSDGKGGYEAKIPYGTYVCIRGDHMLHGLLHPFTTFEVTGVPGHTGLLFHWGNYNKDSEGCILLGELEMLENGTKMITQSRKAFAEFMNIQADVDKFLLTVF